MWDFNKVGRTIAEVTLHRGLIARHTKVWPWMRKKVSGGVKYLVTVTTPQGVEIYNNYHTHKVLFNYVVEKYKEDLNPLPSTELPLKAFSLATALEMYLCQFLVDGMNLVFIPRDKDVSKNFWSKAADQITADHWDSRLDCYVINLTGCAESPKTLVENGPRGRYILIYVEDGFVKSTEDYL